MTDKFPATKTVHCPTGPVNCCDSHASQVVSLLSIMGCHVGVTIAPDDTECLNCINEAKQ